MKQTEFFGEQDMKEKIDNWFFEKKFKDPGYFEKCFNDTWYRR